jgi:methionyl-tRNA formyltransferase
MNDMMPLRLVIITSRLPEDIWLVNKLAAICRVEGIVLPRGNRYPEYRATRVLRDRLSKVGPIAVLDQVMLVLYRRLFEARKDRRVAREIFVGPSSEEFTTSEAQILEVDDANSKEVADFIRAKSPDAVVLGGAPLLKKQIIDAAQGKMINMHPGYAPDYRGRYCGYWPIFNREPEKVGTTLLFVDEGIDTGAILARQRVEFDVHDTLKAITYRQYAAGAAMLLDCLTRFRELSPLARRIDGIKGRNYHAMGLRDYLKAKRWLRSTRGKMAPPRETQARRDGK